MKTATTNIYTLSLHDALPIFRIGAAHGHALNGNGDHVLHGRRLDVRGRDRKSTRLNSSHLVISYAVFCLKKKIKISITSKKRIDVTLLDSHLKCKTTHERLLY